MTRFVLSSTTTMTPIWPLARYVPGSLAPSSLLFNGGSTNGFFSIRHPGISGSTDLAQLYVSSSGTPYE